MSSPKAAAAKSARRPAASKAKATASKPAAGKAVAPKPAADKPAAANGLSSDATRLAADIERAFAKSDDVLSPEALQTLMGTLCRLYGAQVENGSNLTPIPEGQIVSPTAVMVTASGLLRAANLAVFELGMWQSWTGR